MSTIGARRQNSATISHPCFPTSPRESLVVTTRCLWWLNQGVYNRSILELITPHRTIKTIMKPVKGGQGPVWAVAPLIIIIIIITYVGEFLCSMSIKTRYFGFNASHLHPGSFLPNSREDEWLTWLMIFTNFLHFETHFFVSMHVTENTEKRTFRTNLATEFERNYFCNSLWLTPDTLSMQPGSLGSMPATIDYSG
jgi:hypothetical protein